MNIERMQRMVDTLEGLTKDERRRLDMSEWQQQADCGTVGCAVGWYCMKNKSCGLRLEKYVSRPAVVVSRLLSDWNAVESYFGLSETMAEHLFYGPRYSRPTFGHVLARIKKAVANATKEKS